MYSTADITNIIRSCRSFGALGLTTQNGLHVCNGFSIFNSVHVVNGVDIHNGATVVNGPFVAMSATINPQAWKGFDIKHPNKKNHRLRTHLC